MYFNHYHQLCLEDGRSPFTSLSLLTCWHSPLSTLPWNEISEQTVKRGGKHGVSVSSWSHWYLGVSQERKAHTQVLTFTDTPGLCLVCREIKKYGGRQEQLINSLNQDSIHCFNRPTTNPGHVLLTKSDRFIYNKNMIIFFPRKEELGSYYKYSEKEKNIGQKTLKVSEWIYNSPLRLKLVKHVTYLT